MDSRNLDDAAAHALHSLPDDEAAAFDELAASDLELEEEFDSFRRVAVGLIHGLRKIVPAASTELWDRISEEAGIAPETSKPKRSIGGAFRMPLSILGAAAILIAVLAVGGTALFTTEGANDPLSLAAAAAEAPNALNVTLTSPNGVEGITAEVVITADGTGYIVADTLPTLNSDRTYQLWLIVDDRVVSASILGNDPGVVQFRAEGTIAGIAISNEVAGGVVVSEVAPTALWLSDTI